MRITINQLRNIIKEEVSSHMKRSHKLREAPGSDDGAYVFYFSSPESMETHSEIDEEAPNVIVCDDPTSCKRDFEAAVAGLGLTISSSGFGPAVPFDQQTEVDGSVESIFSAGRQFLRLKQKVTGIRSSWEELKMDIEENLL